MGGAIDIEDETEVILLDGPHNDAFGRMRTSSQITVFDSQQCFNNGPLIWDQFTSGTGSATHNLNRSSSILSTGGTANGARALRQTKIYHRYIPGTSLSIKMTGVMLSSGSIVAGAHSQMMYGDDDNGIGVRYTKDGWFIFKRSKVSGSVVETVVPKSEWSLDKFDGSTTKSPSKTTLDPTKSQIFFIDMQWLGVGRVRVGFQIDGRLYIAHEFFHSNIESAVFMQTASLPLRYEVVNVGSGDDISMEAICSAIEIEGVIDEEAGYPWSITNAVTAKTLDSVSYTPVLSIRLKDLFNGGKATRSHIHLGDIESLVLTNPAHFIVVLNPTLAGPVSWTDVNTTHSGIEYDIGATSFTGGVVNGGGYWNTGVGSSRVNNISSVRRRLLLGKTYSGTSDILTIAAKTITGSASVNLSMSVIEQY